MCYSRQLGFRTKFLDHGQNIKLSYRPKRVVTIEINYYQYLRNIPSQISVNFEAMASELTEICEEMLIENNENIFRRCYMDIDLTSMLKS